MLEDLRTAIGNGLLKIDPGTGEIFTSRKCAGKTTGNPWRRAERTLASGYLRIYFTTGGELLHAAAHRAVWMIAHGQNIPQGYQIDHLDFDRANNRVENLEAVTPAENMHRQKVAGRAKGGRPRTIPDETRDAIKAANGSYSQIAKRFGVSISMAWKIRNR